MKFYRNIQGVPDYESVEFSEKNSDYCVLIPVLNEGDRIITELQRAYRAGIYECSDIIICDGNSSDGSMKHEILKEYGVNTMLVKTGSGRYGAQLRMGIHYGLERGYKGFITIDGNNKDSIEDVPEFIDKLKEGFDFVQGSRFIRSGCAENTPLVRYVAVRLIHAPVISLTAGKIFTDTTNGYRAYSKRYLTDERVKPLREIFVSYEILAYLSVRASQLGMKVCEVPVKRVYPSKGKVPTKIKSMSGNFELMKILMLNLMGKYKPVC